MNVRNPDIANPYRHPKTGAGYSLHTNISRTCHPPCANRIGRCVNITMSGEVLTLTSRKPSRRDYAARVLSAQDFIKELSAILKLPETPKVTGKVLLFRKLYPRLGCTQSSFAARASVALRMRDRW